jgi:hypothetical protein
MVRILLEQFWHVVLDTSTSLCQVHFPLSMSHVAQSVQWLGYEQIIEESRFYSQLCPKFLFPPFRSRHTLWSTLPSIQWWRSSSPGVKRRDMTLITHFHTVSKVYKDWSYTSARKWKLTMVWGTTILWSCIGGFSPRVKRAGREADHTPPASAEVKKMWIYTSTPPYAFMA